MIQSTKSALVAAVVGAVFGFAVFLPIYFSSEIREDKTVPGGVVTGPRFFLNPLTGAPIGYNIVYQHGGDGPVVKYERTSACLQNDWMAFGLVAKFHMLFIAAFAVIIGAIGRQIAKRMPESAPARGMVVASEWYGRALNEAKKTLRRWRDYRGRSSRAEALWPLATWLPAMVLFALIAVMLGKIGAFIYIGYLVVMLAALLPLQVRRLHDVNARGWWILAALVVAAGLRLLIGRFGTSSEIVYDLPNLVILAFAAHQYCRRGTPGANRFGEPVAIVTVPAAPVAPVVPAAPAAT